MSPHKTLLICICVQFLSIFVVSPVVAQEQHIRIGHFPNLTHAHGLIAHHSSRIGQGWFEKKLGKGYAVDWYTYNAGPSAMEALLLGAIDFAYVGPNPAINAFIKTKGQEVRIIAGATLGGSALVIQGNSTIKDAPDFRGKKIATPQLGNTQDVAARFWLKSHGINVTQTGGDAQVLPTENPDQLALFQNGSIDAVWTVEPWVSRLEAEAKGKIYLFDSDSITTVFVASAKILRENPQLVEKMLAAHQELNAWIVAHPEQAQEEIGAELKDETGRAVSAALISQAWGRLRFSSELSFGSFESFVSSAKEVGFLKEAGDLSRLMYAGN